MIRCLFESFYTENIDTIAKEICKANADISYTPNPGGVFEEYLNQKTLLKSLIKKQKDGTESKDAPLLDGHKIAACITCAITKARLVSSSTTEDSEEAPFKLETSSRMNEQIALLSGLTCLLAYMADNETNLYPAGKEGGKIDIVFPKTNYDDGTPYIDSLIRALYYSNVLSVNNPLLLAHIFFFIEKYHRTCIELDNLKEALASAEESGK